MNYLVYILESKKLNRYYIGFTSNLDVRMEFHQQGEARKYTYKTDDWDLFLTIDCKNKKQAMDIESHIKKMKSKIYIQNLKKYPEMTEKLIQKFQ